MDRSLFTRQLCLSAKTSDAEQDYLQLWREGNKFPFLHLVMTRQEEVL